MRVCLQAPRRGSLPWVGCIRVITAQHETDHRAARFLPLDQAWGIGDSAKVAVFIFILHLCVLVMFVILGVVYMVFSGGGHLQENFYTHYPDASVADETVEGNTFSALYFGTCAGMLGVSGFESSSQFVESQGPGVFVKTLRNMWIGVVVFNPVISLVSLSVLPLEDVKAAHGSLLAVVADHAGNWLQDAIADMSDWVPRVSSSEYTLGQVLQFIVCVDAFIVLCGAVLTSYVGINGLACRMASDRVLPEFLLNRNRWRNTTHNTALIFFLLSALQVAILKGDVDGLSGVYSFAFLGVMIAFGVGTIMLKFKRPSLPREVTVSFAAACFGVVLVVCTFLGTLMGKSVYVSYFSFYLIGVGAVIIIMFQRVRLLRLLYVAMRSVFPNSAFANLKALISKLRSGPMLFYAKHPDLYVLNKAVLYVRDNEQSNELLIVHVTPYSATSGKAEKPLLEASSTEQVEEGADARREEIERIEAAVKMLDHMYPKLKISFMCVYGGRFNPYIVELIGEKLGIEKIRMMIACPDSVMPDKLAAFGGVRVITH